MNHIDISYGIFYNLGTILGYGIKGVISKIEMMDVPKIITSKSRSLGWMVALLKEAFGGVFGLGQAGER